MNTPTQVGDRLRREAKQLREIPAEDGRASESDQKLTGQPPSLAELQQVAHRRRQRVQASSFLALLLVAMGLGLIINLQQTRHAGTELLANSNSAPGPVHREWPNPFPDGLSNPDSTPIDPRAVVAQSETPRDEPVEVYATWRQFEPLLVVDPTGEKLEFSVWVQTEYRQKISWDELPASKQEAVMHVMAAKEGHAQFVDL